MLARIRRWFIPHWFKGVFAIIAVVWLVTLGAYALGFRGVSFGNRYTGQRATIDFMREHDHTVLELADGVGLQLESGGELHGDIVKLRAGLPGLCWICGSHETAGGIGIVDYRQGDWLFRAPEDLTKNSEAQHGRPESRAFITTIAFDRVTGERLQLDALGVEAQAAALAARGLVVSERTRLTPDALADLPVVSMQREGCVIFNLAFVAVCILWLVFGGLAMLIVRVVRRRR